jgi:hypothetical protein
MVRDGETYAFICIGLEDLQESRDQGCADDFELDGLRVSNLNSLVFIEGATQVLVILFY